MKVYLAILGFLREPDDCYVEDYMVHAIDTKQARELVKNASGVDHHMVFELASVPACWAPHCVSLDFETVGDLDVAFLVPTKWLNGVVRTGLIRDILHIEHETREQLYAYVTAKLLRTYAEVKENCERFVYGPYELYIHFVEDWENLLRLKLAELSSEEK